MFPAQEALLHIQSHIVDLDKDTIITTRLVVPSSDIECLYGENASLSEIVRLTGASIQILPREELPPCVANTDELVQVCHLTFNLLMYSIRFIWYNVV
jgi:poly(rC)-binding protein 2/3/4